MRYKSCKNWCDDTLRCIIFRKCNVQCEEYNLKPGYVDKCMKEIINYMYGINTMKKGDYLKKRIEKTIRKGGERLFKKRYQGGKK